MAKSPSEKITELSQIVAGQFPLFEYRLEEIKKDVEELENRVYLLESQSIQRVAAVEQRCAALEKLSDRGWQVWLALIGAGVALVVAFVKR